MKTLESVRMLRKQRNEIRGSVAEYQTEANELVEYYGTKYGVKIDGIQVKDLRRGRARITANKTGNVEYKITIPVWAIKNGREYFWYYVIHEISHLENFQKFHGWNHDRMFKTIEKAYLQDFGIVPVFKGKQVYPAKLMNANGETYYERGIK